MKPLRTFLEEWFEELEPDREKRELAVYECVALLRLMSKKHTSLVVNLACVRFLSLDGGE